MTPDSLSAQNSPMPNAKAHSRRRFIGFGLAATAGIATRSRAQSVNEKLNIAIIAIIGAGGRGGANTNGVKSETLYTLCDINRKTLEAAKAKHPGAKTTTDWREPG